VYISRNIGSTADREEEGEEEGGGGDYFLLNLPF